MFKKIVLLLIINCFVFMNYVCAADWHNVMYKTYIDSDSFKIKGNILDFWTKEFNDEAYKGLRFYNKKMHFMLAHHQINCTNKTHALLELITYDKYNRLLRSFDLMDTSFWEITPDSKIDTYTYLCGLVNNKKK